MTTITLIGPGAVGLTVGAGLLDAGHDVRFVARQAFDTLTVKTDEGVFRRHQVKVIGQNEIAPTDWVFLCVKAHQVASAAEALTAAIGPDTRVAVLQNGVEHRERVAPFTQATAVPAMVDVPAGKLGRGEAMWRGRAILNVQDDGDGQAFCQLFDGTFVKASTVDDLTTRMWRKLCVNAPGGAILCLAGKPMKVFHQPGIIDVARGILQECVTVGRAEGANLDPAVIEEQLKIFLDAYPDESNSMFDDFRAGRETEWDARNGVLVRKGIKHGIPTPVSNVIVPLLAAQNP
ncbi:MAG TPA: 2-dehydropantoate 2-reductase [Asticcacaulis sp.]|nr:2-dehydropantoate 2-reductase [Asticcacaulis sp.]